MNGETVPRLPGFKRADSNAFALLKDALSVLAHGAYASTGVAVAVVRAHVPTEEVEAPRAVRARPAERRRPVVAVRASSVQVVVPAVACSGKENGGTVRAGEPSSIHAVLRHPL